VCIALAAGPQGSAQTTAIFLCEELSACHHA